MTGSSQPRQDTSGPQEERLRHALQQLARSTGSAPLLSGAELRALAERPRRRWPAASAVAVAGLLVSATAFAAAGGFAMPGHTAPGHGSPAASSTPPALGAPLGSAPAVPGGTSAASGPAATPPRSPAVTAPSYAQRPPLSAASGVAACVAAREGEALVSLHELSVPDTLAPGRGATLAAIPLSCTHGHLAPGGPLQQLEVAPDAEVTTTAPLSSGARPTPSTLEGLAVSLARRPDQLFGIQQDTSGRVTRLDEVYVG